MLYDSPAYWDLNSPACVYVYVLLDLQAVVRRLAPTLRFP